MIDDNSVDVAVLSAQYPNIRFLQLSIQECWHRGFRDMNLIVSRKAVIAWDKAVYYFSTINSEHNNVWFVEDDVFFHNEQTLINIDNKYPDDDIICNSDYKPDYNPCGWWWPRTNINLPLPFTNGMVCATRMSARMREHITTYALANKKLDFLEAFLPTLALHHNLKHQIVPELSTVQYKLNYLQKPAKVNRDTAIVSMDSICPDYIHHAFKNMEDHIALRDFMSKH